MAATGTVHWIDHVVVGTNDMGAWVEWAADAIGLTPGRIGGLTTEARKNDRPIAIFLDIGDGSCHMGAFLQKEQLPQSKGLGLDYPRYGFFVRPEDIDEHLRRLDGHGIAHSDPVRTMAEGDEGTAVYFQDPDGNQFEFWAPVHMPKGAMEVATGAGVGRVSSATLGSRNLQRTAAFFSDYCDIEPIESSEIAEDSVAFSLAGGARIVYHLVDEVDERLTGHGPWYALHAALTVAEDAFFPNYRRMWEGIPEESATKDKLGLPREEEDALVARTGLHTSPSGRKWKQTYERGDEFYDWDGHAFHFVGATHTSIADSLAVYRPKEASAYLKELAEAVGAGQAP